MALDEEMLTLLGAAVWEAQRVEFGLYGLAAHMSHRPFAQKEKRLKDLNARAFLDGNAKDFKMTLGQLATALGDELLISGPELEAFYEDRNLIAHNFYREYGTNLKGRTRSDDPKEFLRDFIARATDWRDVLSGLLCVMMEAAAEKEGRLSEVNLTVLQQNQIKRFREHAGQHLLWKATTPP